VPYEVRIEAGHAFNHAMKLEPTWAGSLVFIEDDGKITETGVRSSYFQHSDDNKRRTRAKLNLLLGRYRNYHARTGQRFELEQRAKREAEKVAKDAQIARRRQLKEAAPEMWKALNALYLDFTSEHTAESIRTGPHVCLILAALQKAGPQPELDTQP
jgi:hypothetical protein